MKCVVFELVGGRGRGVNCYHVPYVFCGFTLHSLEQFDIWKMFCPTQQASEITKACGAKWGLMNEEEKRPHQEKAIADRKRYEGEVGPHGVGSDLRTCKSGKSSKVARQAEGLHK